MASIFRPHAREVLAAVERCYADFSARDEWWIVSLSYTNEEGS